MVLLFQPHSITFELHFSSQYSQPFHVQCLACLWKQYWSYWRNLTYTGIVIVLILLFLFCITI
ncbi:hypothetical protein ACS0TY_035030 [Phlomoides rotata]